MFKIIIFTVCILQMVTTFQINKYYLSYPLQNEWTEALRTCKRKGYDLVSIDSLQKEHEIEEYLRAFNNDGKINSSHVNQIWTSALKSEDNGEFYWTPSNNKLTYTKWLPDQPSNYNAKFRDHENCIALKFVNNTYIGWNDTICSMQYYFLCEENVIINGSTKIFTKLNCLLIFVSILFFYNLNIF